MADDSETPSGRRLGAAFTFDVIAGRDVVLDVHVQHRESEDEGWSTAGSTSIFGTSVATLVVRDLKKERRFKFAVVPSVGTGRVHVRILPPQWLAR